MENHTETDFIESLGLILQNDGLPRIAGRLLGVFVLYGGPFGFPELCDKLLVSRASVSTNTRLLVDLGAIERVGVPGERQDYFRLAENPYTQLIERWMSRAKGARDSIATTAAAVPDSETEMRARIIELSRFYDVLATAGEAALKTMHSSSDTPPAERAALVAGE